MELKKLNLQCDGWVSVIFTEGEDTYKNIISKETFVDLYLDAFHSEVVDDFMELKMVVYEPDASLFHLRMQDDSVRAFDSYSDHPLLQAFHNLFPIVKTDEKIIQSERYGTDQSSREDWAMVLRQISIDMEIEPRIKRLKDIPSAAFIKGTKTKILLDKYGITEQTCVDDATTAIKLKGEINADRPGV